MQDVQELCSNMAIINKGQLLYAGAPNDALHAVKGRIWEKSIAKSELDGYNAAHTVISNKLIAGRPVIHVYSDARPDGFESAEPTLEDVFFSHINGAFRSVAA